MRFLPFLSSFKRFRSSPITVYQNKRLNRRGDQLAYFLTHPNSYNFEEKQRQLLLNILNYAKENVPYYRLIMNGINLNKEQIISNLEKIPLLSKEIIRHQDKNIFSEEFDQVFSYWMNTGGSTGEPLKFPVSKNFEYLHARCLYSLMGKVDGDIVAALDGTRIEDDCVENNIFWKTGKYNYIYGNIHFSTLHMNDNTLKYYVDHLNKIKPAIMRGYPSGFDKIAKYLESNNCDLKFIPKSIYLTSEFFDSSASKLIQKSFKCPVFGQYGHSEVSIFAFTLANSLEYICSPLYGFTEVLNTDGYHVKEGESGEVVVTGFSNKVMPFIRYRTGDIAIYGGTKNGIVKLKSLQGRSIDYILNIKNEKIYLIGLIFGGHLKSFNTIKSWQIEQNFPGIILIRIVRDIGYTDMAEKEIVNLFNSVGIATNIDYVTNIAPTNRGKRRFLIQNIC